MSAYYTMNPADLPALLTAWQSGSRVLCPCKEQDGTTRLESFVPEKGLCLDYTNLAMPPVDVLNGYQDVLFRWEGNERTYVAEPGAEAMAPTVIFGMRPCDVSALEYLDDFYLGEYRDINYSMRREAVTIVGMNCRTPGKSCCMGWKTWNTAAMTAPVLPCGTREKLLLRGHGHRPLCPQRL